MWLILVAAGQESAALFIMLFAVELPFRLWSALGLPVGHRTDFYGWPNPNALGLTLIALTDLAMWYVAASALAAAIRTVTGTRAT